MPYAAVGPITVFLPETVEDNQYLAEKFPKWDIELIYAKTGIRRRHIAGPDQCASDLGVAAAEQLFRQYDIDRSSIDFLLFCTQSPDYIIPTTACIMQQRLGLPRSVGALDFNLGCSGFVYGLALADGLIRSGSAHRVLLITAETYSRYIDPTDRALRTIFSDGAAATLVEASEQPSIGPFVFGTDGAGADTLLVCGGGARAAEQAIQPRKRKRWPSSLFMDGPELVKFTLEVVPEMIDRLLALTGWDRTQVDMFLMHQPTSFLLRQLREKLQMDEQAVPEDLEDYGNTVSSTLPILMRDLRNCGRLVPGKRALLLGFGVGLSWAGCAWTETWQAGQQATLDAQATRKAA